MSREGRSQPIQPFASHGFLGNTPANGVLPQPITVVPLIDERRRQLPVLPPIAISGAATFVAPQTVVAPPAPTVVEPDERKRRARKAPDPVVLSGASAPVQPPAVSPPGPVVVDRTDQRGRYRAPEPTVLSGVLAPQQQPTANPPSPTVVPLEFRRPASGGGVISVGYPSPDNLPTAPVNVDRPEPRARYKTPDPVVISAALNATQPPVTVTPPAPFVVPLDERRRFLAKLDPFYNSGTLPEIPETFVPPPGPYVVPIEERRYILDRLRQPTSSHGFLGNTPANGVLPPPGVNLDRADQRPRYLPQPSLVLSGVLVPFVPPPPVVVNAGTDWAAEMSTF